MLIASSIRRISLEIGGETVTLICRPPSGAEMSKFLNSRFESKRNKVTTRVFEARAEFFDKIAVDMENGEFEDADGVARLLGKDTVLTDADKAKWSALTGAPVAGWKDLVPVNWKSSFMQRFEDSADAEETQGKN